MHIPGTAIGEDVPQAALHLAWALTHRVYWVSAAEAGRVTRRETMKFWRGKRVYKAGRAVRAIATCIFCCNL